MTLRRTAYDHGKGHQRAVEAIYENFYVADYLDSADTSEQAIDLGRQVKAILEKGDFHLCKWLSNSAIVRDEFGDKTGSETNFTTDWETKVLGVKWNALSDTFSFSVNRLDDITYTKRSLLSKLS